MPTLNPLNPRNHPNLGPREWMSFEDFIALTQACGANNDAVPEILEDSPGVMVRVSETSSSRAAHVPMLVRSCNRLPLPVFLFAMPSDDDIRCPTAVQVAMVCGNTAV